ncbi:hypothetical protein NL676_035035 [Syzygium grande]|nr:hypothetical protein NL676_035035 [Syzygium grande]
MEIHKPLHKPGHCSADLELKSKPMEFDEELPLGSLSPESSDVMANPTSPEFFDSDSETPSAIMGVIDRLSTPVQSLVEGRDSLSISCNRTWRPAIAGSSRLIWEEASSRLELASCNGSRGRSSREVDGGLGC